MATAHDISDDSQHSGFTDAFHGTGYNAALQARAEERGHLRVIVSHRFLTRALCEVACKRIVSIFFLPYHIFLTIK